MDGRNSSGRKISLLNDHSDAPLTRPCFPSRVPPLSAAFQRYSESPSEVSTPTYSPQTPPLVRSESSDSAPSPLTPQSASFDHASQLLPSKQAAHHQHRLFLSNQNWSKMDDASLYPAMPENSSLSGYSLPPMTDGTAIPDPRIRSSDSPASESRASNVSGASAPKQSTKKSQYPCPLAKQYKCSDFFTTSGHAARHAKKHTGRKDAICPECNKAFTRKDNMEQHRRTHQNVRGPSKPSENRIKKSKQTSRKSDKDIPAASLESAMAQLEDEQLAHQHQPTDFPLTANHTVPPTLIPGSGGPYYMNPDPVAALPQPMPTDYNGRPSFYRSGYSSSLDLVNPTVSPHIGDTTDLHFSYPSPGLSNGLNTLALAASGHQRVSEEADSTKSTSTTP